MLFSVLSWIIVIHFSIVSLSSIDVNYNISKIVQLELYQTMVYKKLLIPVLKTLLFIVLIHPIQWTITNPVGADRPAKRQKKTSCVSTGRPVPSTSALARWRVVLPSCLDSVTS